MIIYNADGTTLLEVEVDDNSYRTRSIMGDNNIVLYYSLSKHVEIPVGAYCEFEGETYTLMRPEAFKMRHSRNFEYTVTMESAEGWAKVWKFRNMDDHRLKFPFTAKPSEHLGMLVRNLNARDSDPTWAVGTCIEGDEVYISYDHAYCYEAIGQMADTFGCEFEFDCKNKTVSLWKIEHNKENPLPLAYGQGNGFKPNVGRANYGDTPPIDILYVQGGTDNIDSSKYKGWDGAASSYLLLPAGRPTLGYDGEHFDYEEGFDESNAKNYVVTDDRYSIYQVGKDISTPVEDSLDCSEIYPKRVGEVSEVFTIDESQHFYDFSDETIPDDLDYNKYLIDGETMTVIFQSGMLAGKEFEISKYDASTKRFEIVPQEIDGITMPDPDTNYMPEVGNTYAIFHCYLPDEYIRNDENHEGAEWDLFREAVKYMYENEDQKFTFSGDLDGIWSKKDWGNIGGRIILGGYVLFTDERFQPDGAMLRIISVKDYVNKPYSPTIELSNCMVTTSFSTTMKQLESQNVLIEQNQRDALQFTKRRFRDAQETITMLEAAIDSFETNFTESISPITVQTMSLLVGDESLQFRFVNNYDDRQTVYPSITYADGELVCRPNGMGIIHMTLNIDNISSSHSDSEYNRNFWEIMASSTTLIPTDPNKGYYLYLKANRSTGTAEFYLSDTSISMEAEDGYYYFLVGILNSEYDGDRSFVTLYGYTEVLPGRITTDRIVSGDANSYMDLVNNAFKLGDKLRFNVNGDGQLVLQGTLVQSSGSTDTSYIGCYRGEWNSTYTYFNGDEVSYTDSNGVTSTYRCIAETSVSGTPPTDSTYWQVLAAGVKGSDGTSVTIKGTIYSPDDLPMSGNTEGDGYLIDGDLWVWDGTQWNDVGQIQGPAGSPANYYEIRYATNGSPTSAPSIDNASRNPSGWNTTMPTVSDGYYLWMTMALINGETDALESNWGSPVRISGEKGEDGKSPVMVFCGEYDPDTEYNGTDYRLDCVKYGDQYYIARIDAGTFKGIVPTETSKWNTFGASFESIATGLLLAEWANIGGWVFKGDILISQKGTVSGVESTDYENANFKPYVTLDGKQGKVYTGNGVTMDADGITLTDDSGNVVAKIVRESIGGETDLDGGTQEEEDRTYPSGGTDNRVKDQYWCSLPTQKSTTTVTLFTKEVDLGRFNSTDDTLSQMGAQLNAGSATVLTTGMTISYAQLTLQILKDGVVVAETYDRHDNIRDGGNLFANDYQVSYNANNFIANNGVGSYSIVITFTVTYSGTPDEIPQFWAYLYTAYFYHKNGIRRTLIGTDGMYSCWGNNMYFRTAADSIRLRMGDNVLRINENNGIQKSSNGGTSWTSL